MRALAARVGIVLLCAGTACVPLGPDEQGDGGGGTDAGGDGGGVPPPSDGGGSSIDTAAAKYPDIPALWTSQIVRTCGPNNGVCHHSLQFPDMQTQSGFVGTINQRCNQIRQEPSQIDNLCEPVGDTFQYGAFTTELGNVSAAPGADGGVGTLTVTLKDVIPTGASGALAIVRQLQGLPSVTIPIPAAALVSATAGHSTVVLNYNALTSTTKAPAPGGTVATFLYPATWTPGNEDQVIMGDPNGDGIFGASLGGALIKPGKPLSSYLFLRLLSPLALGPGNTDTNTIAPATNEAQMPIANFIYWDLQNSMTALWCWISGLAPDGSNALSPIDYAHCDVSQMPTPVSQQGEATTWTAVYSNILQSQCVSCHHTGTTYATTLYMDDAQHTYDVLLGITGSGPSENALGLPYVTPASPSQSYLYLKVTGAPGIQGAQMPLGGQLSPGDLTSISTWITQGAQND